MTPEVIIMGLEMVVTTAVIYFLTKRNNLRAEFYNLQDKYISTNSRVNNVFLTVFERLDKLEKDLNADKQQAGNIDFFVTPGGITHVKIEEERRRVAPTNHHDIDAYRQPIQVNNHSYQAGPDILTTALVLNAISDSSCDNYSSSCDSSCDYSSSDSCSSDSSPW